MPELSKKDKLRLLTLMLESRHADLREQSLNRQGKGHFHTPGMGHEALAAISIQMDPDDYIVPFYRDRGLVLGRGMTVRQLGLDHRRYSGLTENRARSTPSRQANTAADLYTASFCDLHRITTSRRVFWPVYRVRYPDIEEEHLW